jgi:hypothetical protein
MYNNVEHRRAVLYSKFDLKHCRKFLDTPLLQEGKVNGKAHGILLGKGIVVECVQRSFWFELRE